MLKLGDGHMGVDYVNFTFFEYLEFFHNNVLSEFIGVTLVNKIIQVLGAQFCCTSSVRCIVSSPSQVKSRSIIICPPYPSSSPSIINLKTLGGGKQALPRRRPVS